MEDSEGEGAPSRLLWVGNVASDASEALLIQTFAKYGAVDYVSVYPARSYAFIEFRDLEDAKEAKSGLQGRLVKGQSLRIEFARPAKPSRHVWIWGVSETVTKEQLEAEFKKFGPLDDFRLLRDRNSALAEFRKIQDATAAVKGLNKKKIQGEELRVDYLRSQSSKRGHTGAESFSQTVTEERVSKEGVPSDTLWIGFPPPSRVDEEGLRRAFILFGEVERITTFPDRSYCFVQFRNVDEATRAKEGLQGRLLNDPRILIRFSSNEAAPKRTTRPEGYSMLPTHLRGTLAHSDVGGMRPGGAFEWPASALNLQFPSRYSAVALDANRSTKGFVRAAGGTSAGLLSAHLGTRGGVADARLAGTEFFADNRLLSGDAMHRASSEASDRDYPPREHKRPNLGITGYSEGYVESGFDSDERYRDGQGKAWLGAHDSRQPNVHPDLRRYEVSQAGLEMGTMDNTTSRTGISRRDQGMMWKGSIAKAGVFVCHAQSFFVGKGIESSLPGVVNCVARTSLDLLAQHFHQAADFGVIYFVPDGDSESASYKEFVSYLGDKNRAGVANTDDGTTLFLVPPSEFAENDLKLHGDCLFGLVIKPRQQAESAPYHQPALPPVQGHHQHHAFSQPKTAVQEDIVQVQSMPSASATVPPADPEGHPWASETAYLTPSLRDGYQARLQDDQALPNGAGTPSNVESLEGASHDMEGSRVNIYDTVRDPMGSFQSASDNPYYWNPSSSTLTDPFSRLPAEGNPDERSSGGGLEHVLASLQSGPREPSSATQMLLRHALLAQGGTSTDGSDPSAGSASQDATRTGVAHRHNASEGDASDRFQATLQLAAALLQRMHNGKTAAGGPPTS